MVIAAARAVGLEPWRILDDSEAAWGSEIMGVPIAGGLGLLEPDEAAHIAIGSNVARRRIAEARPEAAWTTILHPFSWICPTASIGPGSLVCAGAVIQPEAVLGPHVIVNTRASVDHECELGGYAQAAPGAALGGRVKIGLEGYAGIGCSVHQGSEIGERAVLGGGAFLKGSIPQGEVWAGVPARRLTPRPGVPSPS